MGMKNRRKRRTRSQTTCRVPKAEHHEANPPQTATALPLAENPSAPLPVAQETLPFEGDLLERARTQWVCGDWEGLSRIEADSIRYHQDRASVIMLAAAARQQRGDPETASSFAKLAKEWGCDRSFMARVLIGNVHETIGRASLAMGNTSRAQRHFTASLALATPGIDSSLIAQSRMAAQLHNQSALLELRQARLRLDPPHEDQGHAGPSKRSSYQDNPRFAADAYAFYRSIATPEQPSPFLLIDSKSLPRSGLHYLKNTLSRLLPDQFSFCEWYQEPGCCKKMPCALRAYAEASQRLAQSKIRLIKSHDFLLDDPDFPVSKNIQRLILIRHPLYILTSWFELEEFNRYREVLQQHSLDMKKIWLYHEPEVTALAVRLIDEVYQPRDERSLVEWLLQKSKYIAGFMEKWAYPAIQQPDLGWRLVTYDEVHDYVADLIATQIPHRGTHEGTTLNTNREHARNRFKPRTDPFTLKSKAISEDVRRRSRLFTEASGAVVTSELFEKLGERLVAPSPA